MSTPTRPGWHPAPDGRGEQWWNGVSWSESRRGTQPVAAPHAPGSAGYSSRVTAPPSWTPAAVSNVTPAHAPAPAPHSNITPPAPVPHRPNPYAATPPAAAPATSVANSQATTSLVLGLVSLFLVQLLSPIAIIVSILALRRLTALGVTSGNGRVMATIGLVAGVLGLGWGIIQLVFVGFALDGFWQ